MVGGRINYKQKKGNKMEGFLSWFVSTALITALLVVLGLLWQNYRELKLRVYMCEQEFKKVKYKDEELKKQKTVKKIIDRIKN